MACPARVWAKVILEKEALDQPLSLVLKSLSHFLSKSLSLSGSAGMLFVTSLMSLGTGQGC